MSPAVLDAFYILFVQIWRFFTQWYFPGTSITPASWFFFSASLVLALKILKIYFMGGGDSVD